VRRILRPCNKVLESTCNRTPPLDFCSAIITSNAVAHLRVLPIDLRVEMVHDRPITATLVQEPIAAHRQERNE